MFPKFEAGAPLRIAAITAAQAGLRLMGCNLNARNLPGSGFGEVGALARAAPAFVLHYGDFDQLEGIVDVLARLLLDEQRAPADPRRFLSAFSQPAAAATEPAHRRTGLRNPGAHAAPPGAQADHRHGDL